MPDSTDRKRLGKLGEDKAAEFLRQKGYLIRERNFRCKLGEIDLIADHDEYLVFVEVKSRYASKEMISPLISMTRKKCNRIRLLGQTYLNRYDIKQKQPRFDVIGIVFQNKEQYSLEHIKNAF
jgi:putative endonuclease